MMSRELGANLGSAEKGGWVSSSFVIRCHNFGPKPGFKCTLSRL